MPITSDRMLQLLDATEFFATELSRLRDMISYLASPECDIDATEFTTRVAQLARDIKPEEAAARTLTLYERKLWSPAKLRYNEKQKRKIAGRRVLAKAPQQEREVQQEAREALQEGKIPLNLVEDALRKAGVEGEI